MRYDKSDASSRHDEVLSFIKQFRRWYSTVFTDTKSWPAPYLFVRPVATSRATASSAPLRPSAASGASVGTTTSSAESDDRLGVLDERLASPLLQRVDRDAKGRSEVLQRLAREHSLAELSPKFGWMMPGHVWRLFG